MESEPSEIAINKEKWAKIWFGKLIKFHNISNPHQWQFSSDDVIAFLVNRRKFGMPTWKRIKVVEALIWYRNYYLKSAKPRLESIRSKLIQLRVSEDLKTNQLSEEDLTGKIDQSEPDIIQRLRKSIRVQGKSYATEKAYVGWIKRFMNHLQLLTVDELKGLDSIDIENYLTDLVVDGNVSPSTQDQAFYSLLFFFQHVLKKDLGAIDAVRSKKPKLTPTVLSKSEVTRVLKQLTGISLTVGKLLYGCGLRIIECLRLRVMDIDIDQLQIRIFNSKGKKSRLVPLPNALVDELSSLLQERIELHLQDEKNGQASVWLPLALSRKFPNAHKQLKWQYFFASQNFSLNPVTRNRHRHHIHPTTFPNALKQAVQKAKINKHVTSHTFRHSFATHLLENGVNIRIVQELLGHQDVKTTMIYTHVLNQQNEKVLSPLDTLSSVPQKG